MTAPQTEDGVRMIPDPDYDPIQVLTLAELDAGSRLLKADVIAAITQQTDRRWEALAIAAWLLARREDRTAQLDTFRQMSTGEFNDFMAARTPMIPAPADDDTEAPDDPAAAAAAEIAADPTGSGPGS